MLMSCKCERLALRRITPHRLSKGLSSASEGQNGIQHQDINRFTSPPYTGRHTSSKLLIPGFFFCACLSFIIRLPRTRCIEPHPSARAVRTPCVPDYAFPNTSHHLSFEQSYNSPTLCTPAFIYPSIRSLISQLSATQIIHTPFSSICFPGIRVHGFGQRLHSFDFLVKSL